MIPENRGNVVCLGPRSRTQRLQEHDVCCLPCGCERSPSAEVAAEQLPETFPADEANMSANARACKGHEQPVAQSASGD